MPSLWYFQNCFEASFPATRCRTTTSLLAPPDHASHSDGATYSFSHRDAHPERLSSHRRPRRSQPRGYLVCYARRRHLSKRSSTFCCDERYEGGLREESGVKRERDKTGARVDSDRYTHYSPFHPQIIPPSCHPLHMPARSARATLDSRAGHLGPNDRMQVSRRAMPRR